MMQIAAALIPISLDLEYKRSVFCHTRYILYLSVPTPHVVDKIVPIKFYLFIRYFLLSFTGFQLVLALWL